MNNIGKIPPQAIEVEEAVLGSLLLDNECFMIVSDILPLNSFYKNQNNIIYNAINNVYDSGLNIDIITVTQQLTKSKELKSVGGAYYVTQLTNRVSSSHNVEQHARIVFEKFIKREIIRLSNELLTKSYDDSIDTFNLTDSFLEYAYLVNNFDEKTNTIKSNYELLKEVENKIKTAKEKKGVTGIPTGFYELDSCTGGYQKQDLIIKAARPSMGKTAQALCEAIYMAYNLGKKVLFFSLEMSAEQLMTRMVSIQTEISNNKIKSGEFTDYDWQQFNAKTEILKNDNLIIYDRINKIQNIRKAAKKEKTKRNIDAIFIDYLQIVTGVKGNNREQEISELSSSLKRLAKEIDCPVICLSQLSRAVETRGGDKKPMLSDLRDSGSIEQDADIVQFLYRPEYYGLTEDSSGNSTEGKAYMLIRKNRNGSLKDIEFRFIGYLTKFIDSNCEINQKIDNEINPNEDFELTNNEIDGLYDGKDTPF